MMPHARHIAAALLSMLLASTGRADSPPLVSAAYPPPYVITQGAAPTALTIPLKLDATLAAAGLCVEKVGARYQNLLDDTVSDHFSVEKRVAEDGKPVPRLRMSLQRTEAMRPGDYQLMLRFFKCAKPLALALAQPVFTFSIPYAKLEAPGKQTLELRLSTPWSDTGPVSGTIDIERGSDSAFVPIRDPVLLAGPFSDGSSENVGKWQDVKLGTVAPHQPVRFNLAPHAFRPGTAKGQVFLRSTDLQAPLSFDVELRTRLRPAWILVMIVLGFLLGQWLRHRVQGRIDLGESKQLAIDALAGFQRDVERIGDTGFRADINTVLGRLFQAIRSGDKAQVDAALLTARQDVAKRRDVLQTALNGLAVDIQAYRNAFNVNGALPPPFDELCRTVERDVEPCMARVDAMDAKSARVELTRRSKDAMNLLTDALTGLRLDAENLARKLDAANALLTPNQRDAASAGQPEFRKTLESIVPVTEQANVNEALSRVVQLKFLAALLLSRYALAMEGTANEVEDLVQKRIDSTGPLPGTPMGFKPLLRAIAADMRSQAETNPLVLRDWPNQAPAALGALRSALIAMIGSRRALADRKEVLHALVNSERWYETFAQVSEFNPTLKAVAAPGASLVAATAPIAPASPALSARTALNAPDVADLTLPDIQLAERENRKALRWSKIRMAFGSGAIMALATYAVYEDKFVGNNLELLALFIWGFSADMTLSGLLEKLTPFKGAQQAG